MPTATINWIPCEDEPSQPHELVMIAIYDANGKGQTDVAWRSDNPAEEFGPNDPTRFLMWVDGYGVSYLSGPKPHRVRYWARLAKPPTT